MRDENLALREEVDRASMFEEIVGTSPALRAVLTSVAQVAPTDSTVLITGETGTGKELVARAIHKRSPRASRAFVSVNCAAIPPTLIASELFGHEKGAFTGALQRRVGRFELADGGTIFLDEIGDLPPDTQLALLRVLQEREFERVGSARPIKVDVRVIAATNRDLNAAIEGDAFRTDLFYRLNVFPIEMPPLRERPSDIPLLVAYFVERYARNVGKTIRQVEKRTLELVQSYRSSLQGLLRYEGRPGPQSCSMSNCRDCADSTCSRSWRKEQAAIQHPEVGYRSAELTLTRQKNLTRRHGDAESSPFGSSSRGFRNLITDGVGTWTWRPLQIVSLRVSVPPCEEFNVRSRLKTVKASVL